MFEKPGDQDTICAVSTAPGVGGIAVVRVSGERAAEVARRCCRFLPSTLESHRVYYGFFTDKNDEPVDEVLLSYFAPGRSFTGEETIEVSCHGGQVITASVLQELIAAGARLANRGEFTYRAFMNGRIDLVQAESVLGLIESQSKPSAKIALRQLKGSLSSDFQRIEDDLVWILAQLEASIDFSTEGLDTVSPELLSQRAKPLKDFVDRMIASYQQGKLLRQGLQVALVGRPNAGKSSLLNAFLKEERAIVTPEAGTTRDTVEGRLMIEGIPVTLVDTAGLRETDNMVEKMGITRSLNAMQESDLILRVIDGQEADWSGDLEEAIKSDTTTLVFNKTDLPFWASQQAKISEVLRNHGLAARAYFVSAQTGQGLDKLEALFATRVAGLDPDASSVVTQARHVELLQKISACLTAALKLMHHSEVESSSPEFIAFELQVAVRAVHELLGKEFHEQVIDRIFKEFCLGK